MFVVDSRGGNVFFFFFLVDPVLSGESVWIIQGTPRRTVRKIRNKWFRSLEERRWMNHLRIGNRTRKWGWENDATHLILSFYLPTASAARVTSTPAVGPDRCQKNIHKSHSTWWNRAPQLNSLNHWLHLSSETTSLLRCHQKPSLLFLLFPLRHRRTTTGQGVLWRLWSWIKYIWLNALDIQTSL